MAFSVLTGKLASDADAVNALIIHLFDGALG